MEWDLKHHLTEHLGIDPAKKVLLGFSGGHDSLCLLHLLLEHGFQVVAAHLDHGLRASSATDAEYAEEVCMALGVEFVTRRLDVAAHARHNHFTVEESARVLRYEFLFDEANRTGAQAVLVAHNADDQVETVLMHLLRGSGLSGLAGMRAVLLPNPWSCHIPLVRPLIGISRVQIETFLAERGLAAIVDESNTDQQYFRNRIRHELLPTLESYNPRIRERMLRMADVAAGEDEFLRMAIDEVWAKAVEEQGERYLVVDGNALLSLHHALLRRFMRRAIEWMDADLRDIDFEVINRAAVFSQMPTRSKRIDLLAGIEMFLYGHRLVFARVHDPLHALWPQVQMDEQRVVPVPGHLNLSPHWRLRVDTQGVSDVDTSPFTAYLDAQKITGGLRLSRPSPGDRFTPFGLDGHTKKLGDFWNSVGLPARARSAWPLIRSAEGIVWVPGFRVAHHARVDATTTEVIRLEVEEINRQ
jgi:tRNA(Ile)-lysidine synthase